MASTVTPTPARWRRSRRWIASNFASVSRAREQPQVEAHRPPCEIGEIELDHVLVAQGVRSLDLPEAGKTGTDEMPACGTVIECVRVDSQGSRSDNAHVATENVHELRELVD